MSSLSDITLAYIDQAFQPELKTLILRAVSSVFDDAQITSYEVTLNDIITQDELVSSDDIRDMFLSSIRQVLLDMTQQYLLTVDTEEEPTLLELIQICEALSLSAKLETVDPISGILYSDRPARLIAVDIISRLSIMPQQRAMELITDAQMEVIDAIRSVYSEDSSQEEQKASGEVLKTWALFSRFTDGVPSLGVELSQRGFKHLELKHLIALSGYPVRESVELSEVPQIALDILSLVIYAQDTCGDPMKGVDDCMSTYVTDTSVHNVLKDTIQRIHSDFKLLQGFESQTQHIQEAV